MELKMTCFRIDGQTVKQYCNKNGISYNSFYRYVDKHGLSIEEALKKAQSKHKDNLKWVVGGKSLYKFCMENDLIYNAVVRGVKKGLSIEQAIEKSRQLRYKKGTPVKYSYNGESLLHYCYRNNINYGKVYYWMNKGLGLDKALMRCQDV